MKKWAMPLWIFIGGQFILLVLFVFMPAIDNVQTSTAAATATVSSTFWGWGWLMTAGVVRWLLYAFGELIVMVVTGIALLKSRT
jgi:hypothetical protein